MSEFLELQIKLLEKERVELREEIIKLKAENKKQLASTDVSQQREMLVLEEKAYYAGWTHGDLEMRKKKKKWKNRTNTDNGQQK